MEMQIAGLVLFTWYIKCVSIKIFDSSYLENSVWKDAPKGINCQHSANCSKYFDGSTEINYWIAYILLT